MANIDDLQKKLAIDDDFKERVYKDLADVIIASLEDGTMTVEESEQSAEFIYNGIEKAGNYLQLTLVLYQLAQRWPQFTAVMEKWMGQKK